MFNTSSWVSILSIFTLVSCASAKKEAKPVQQNEGRVFQVDYVIQGASSREIPKWIEKPLKGDKLKQRKKHRYFVSESANKNKRLCLKSAEARATARIASEIAQFVKNTYGESTQGGDADVTEYMEESLAQEAQSFIVGARVHKTYWEKRRYKEALGAEEDETKFTCFALIKMSKKLVKKAIDKSTAKLYGDIEDPEVKKSTRKILKDVGDAFNKLETPVKVQTEE